MSPTRRAVLGRVGAAALAAAIAGCNAPDAADATTDDPDRTPTNERSDSPTAPDEATPSPTASETDGASPPPAYTVDLALARNEYRLAARPEPKAHLPLADATPLSALDDPVRGAVRTAVETGRYETDEPSTALLDGVEDLGMMADGETHYLFTHTFTEYVLNLVTDVDPETVPDGRVVDRESDVVQDRPTIAEAVDTVTPHGTQAPSREYRTLVLTDELAAFLEAYDYVRYAAGVGRLEYAVERQFPPYALSAREATERERYGRPVVDAASFAPETRELVRETLDTHRRTPLRLDDERRRVGALRPDSVPYELERLEHDELLRVDGSLYHFAVGHAHWDRQPMALDATLVDGTVATDDPATVRLSATNTSEHATRVGVPGLLPFGVLWAAPTEGTGESVQLWSDGYERSDLVRVEDGVARPDSYRHERVVDSGDAVSETYAFGRDADALAATSYAVWGVLWLRWPSHNAQPLREWNAALFPYELTLAVESA